MMHALALAAAVLAAAPTDVWVHGTRMRLGALLPAAPEPWASIDLGPTPQPAQARWVTAAQLQARVAQAALPPLPAEVALPPRLRVLRAGQQVHEARLKHMVVAALQARLPAEQAPRAVWLQGGATVGEGEVSVEVEAFEGAYGGRQTLFVAVRSADGAAQRLPVLVDLPPPVRLAPAVARGAQVRILLRDGHVQLETHGLAQQGGRAGDVIAVMPQSGTRMLQGRILDASTVAVQP